MGQATSNYLMLILIRAVNVRFFASRSWHSQDIVKQIGKEKRDNETKIDIYILVLKLLQAKWILKLNGYIRGKPQLVKNDWLTSEIINVSKEKIKLDPFM